MPIRAIISDIHANLEALHAVLDDAEKQKASSVVCLGDILGYGPNPVECVDLVRQNCAWSLAGNHDMAVLVEDGGIGFGAPARRVIEWQRAQLLPGVFSGANVRERWDWLGSLASSRKRNNIQYVHGTPVEPLHDFLQSADFDELRRESRLGDIFAQVDWLVFIGNTHIPGVGTYEFNWLNDSPEAESRWIEPGQIWQDWFDLPMKQKIVVNPGSVGQPRDGIKEASYVLFDGKRIHFRRVPYEIEKTIAKIDAIRAIDNEFGRRLMQGI